MTSSSLGLRRRSLLRSVVGAVAVPIAVTGTGPARATQSAGGTWPMYQFDAQNTGYAADVTGPEDLIEEQWNIEYQSDRHSETGSPPVVTQHGVFADGNMYNLGTGRGLWSGSVTHGFGVSTGDEIVKADDYTLVGVNAADGSTAWTGREVGPIVTTDHAVFDGEHVFLATEQDGPVIKVDPATGDVVASSMEPVRGDETRTARGTPAVGDSHVYCRTPSGVTKFTKETMEPVADADEQGGRIVTLGDGLVYTGPDRWDPAVRAIDTTTMAEVWSADVSDFDGFAGRVTNRSPAYADGLVVSPAGRHIVGVDAQTGDREWSFECAGEAASPSIAGDVAYVGDGRGYVYAVDTSDGSELWRFEVGEAVMHPPAVLEGRIVVKGQSSLTLLTEQPNDPPHAAFSFSPADPVTDEEVTFDAGESTDDHAVEAYDWSIPSVDSVTIDGDRGTQAFEDPGEYDVTLTVTDTGGLTAETTETVNVSRPAEVPEASFTVTPTEPVPGEQVTFSASGSSSPDGEITEYRWVIEGEEKYGEEVRHTFDGAGEFTATLEVTDSNGLSDAADQVIPVSDQELSVSVTGSQTFVSVGEEAQVQFSLVNYLTNEAITAQLVLLTPSGVSVTGVSGAQEGSGQYVAVTDLDPGRSSSITVDLTANEPGEFTVTGRVVYTTAGGEEGERSLDDVTITASADSSSAESGDGSTGEDSEDDGDDGGGGGMPGFGVGTAVSGVVGGVAVLRRVTRSRASGGSGGDGAE